MRSPAARTKPRIAKTAAFPAPTGGWVKNQNLATPGARRPDGSAVNGAHVLENWFPLATSIRVRGGSAVYVLADDGTRPITSLFTYINGSNQKLFASTATGIFDVSTAPPQVHFTDGLGNRFIASGSGDTAVAFIPSITRASTPLTGAMTGGDWSVVQFATPGGVFLRAVNGADTPLVYDGTTWSTTPAITGITNPTTLSNVFVYKQRVFFIQKDTLSAWYLPAASIGGAATELPLGGVFTRGGSLLFGASWSLETLGGLAAQCIFVTTEGEVAVYQGNDPSVAANWSLVGVYRIGKPLGPKAWIHAGGDLVIATDIGFVPLSQAVQRDFSALSPSAISYSIETAWNDTVAQRPGANWHCEVWPSKQMVLIVIPTTTGTSPQMFATNARTGAWASFTGWDGTCVAVFQGRLFFGSQSGMVIEAEVGGSDQGLPYTATCVPLFDPLKSPASLKTGMSARATLLSTLKVTAQLSFQHDFNVNLPPAPADTTSPGGNLWGAAVWGKDSWGGAPDAKKPQQEWRSVSGSGYMVSPAIQIPSGSIVQPDAELVNIDLTYDIGDIVT